MDSLHKTSYVLSVERWEQVSGHNLTVPRNLGASKNLAYRLHYSLIGHRQLLHKTSGLGSGEALLPVGMPF